MAEIFSQDEIDALINEGLSEATNNSQSEEVHPEGPENWAGQGKKKFVRSPKPPEFRFHHSYRSPLVKEENIIFDPDPENAGISDNGKTVVRTLSNFIRFLQTKKQAVGTKYIDRH